MAKQKVLAPYTIKKKEEDKKSTFKELLAKQYKEAQESKKK